MGTIATILVVIFGIIMEMVANAPDSAPIEKPNKYEVWEDKKDNLPNKELASTQPKPAISRSFLRFILILLFITVAIFVGGFVQSL